MMHMDLRPRGNDEIDPRLSPHLEPGETVLWQNRPKPGTFFGPRQIGWAAAWIALGIVVASGLIAAIPAGAQSYGPAAAVGVILLATSWNRRADLWTYAITESRLLSVLKGAVVRSLTPEQLDTCKLKIEGDTVYWLKLIKRNSGVGPNERPGPDGRLVGFHGQTGPTRRRQRR